MRGFALLFTSVSLFVVAPSAAFAQTATTGGTDPADPTQSKSYSGAGTGASEYGVDPDAPPRVLVAGTRAKRMGNGYAAAPADAPRRVQNAIWAANEIVGKPYRYGGGHTSTFKDSGYDCSGTVSYALHGGRFVDSPMPSGSYMSWERAGRGRWITVYANGGHAWMTIAGLRLDTSSAGERVSSGEGPRWRKNVRGGAGFVKRHPSGF
jgi:cell wall-associated NlpC family hydrolase